ncbi:Uncharacterised protein [Bordetella pertussis]|nr:Uncharacterised protein [Bordetella pertussis]
MENLSNTSNQNGPNWSTYTLLGRFWASTVPTMLAMQINISRLTAKRIEPSSSKTSPARLRKVWREEGAVEVAFMKKGGPRNRLPPPLIDNGLGKLVPAPG